MFHFSDRRGATVILIKTVLWNKRSVLRRQCSDTNRNMKKVGVLPIRIVKSNVSSVGPSSERNLDMNGSWFLSDEGPTLKTLVILVFVWGGRQGESRQLPCKLLSINSYQLPCIFVCQGLETRNHFHNIYFCRPPLASTLTRKSHSLSIKYSHQACSKSQQVVIMPMAAFCCSPNCGQLGTLQSHMQLIWTTDMQLNENNEWRHKPLYWLGGTALWQRCCVGL